MIVPDVAGKNSSQAGFAENDDMRKAFSADTAVQAFNVRILPRRAWRRDDFFDAHVLDSLSEKLAVDRVAISKQESRSLVERKRFDDLLNCPLSGRMRGHVEMDDHAAVMA